MPSSLELLLGGCSKDEFFRETFERHPRLFSQALSAADIDALFSIDHLDHIFSNLDLRYPQLEVIEARHAVKPPETIYGVVDRIKCLAKLRDGASMRVRDLQMLSPSVMRFVRRLSQELSGYTRVNVYITPPGEQGFDPHFDRHDFFIVQCFGDKRWILNESYERQMELPNERVLGYEPTRPSNPATEQTIVLHQGDVLYVPRGHLHYATASERGSIHMTVAHTPITWGALLQFALTHAEKTDREFRQTVSPALYEQRVERGDELAAMARRLLSRLDLAYAAGAARRGVTAACPAPSDGIFAEVFRARRIDEETRVALYRDAFFTLERDQDGRVASIAANGTKMVLDGKEKDYVERLDASAEGVTPAELAGPGGERTACVRFVEELFRNGIVGVVEAPAALPAYER